MVPCVVSEDVWVERQQNARLVLTASLRQCAVAVEIDVDSVVPAQYDTGLCKRFKRNRIINCLVRAEENQDRSYYSLD
jgi:hypothetical protein